MVYFVSDNLASAKKLFEKSFLLNNNYLPALNNLTRVYFSLNESEKCLQSAVAANELDPNEYICKLNHALALSINGKIEEGIKILEKLKDALEGAPNNFDIIFKITDTHFANNNFDSCFDMLLNYYPKNKEKIKTKILGYFDVLGFEHESTILYRKKLSSIMFS